MKVNTTVLIPAFFLILLTAWVDGSVQASASVERVPTLRPTATPTATAAPTATPLTTATIPVEKYCIQVEDELPAGFQSEGALLLIEDKKSRWGYYYSLKNAAMYHMDLMSKRKSSFPAFTESALSPDHKWLAYLEESYEKSSTGVNRRKSRVLKVANAEGRYLDMSYWTWNWQEILGWVDERHLLLSSPGFLKDELVPLNPFNGERQMIPVGMPGISRVPPAEYYTDDVVFGPGMKNLAYQDGLWTVAEWDGWKTIWQSNDMCQGHPFWAPNGQSLVFFENTYAQEKLARWLVNVDMDGNARPVTNPLPAESEALLSWSPNSSTLAGWLQLEPSTDMWKSTYDLVLINTKKPRLIDLCIQRTGYRYNPLQTPVWSLDGRFIAVPLLRTETNQWGYEIEVEDTGLIDLQTMRAYRLVKNAVPYAWMRKPGK